MINIPKKIYKEIKKHSSQMLPEECCGLVVYKDESIISFPCQNIADNKLDNFTICPKDYIAASFLGKIVAFYHSHTSPLHDKDFTILDKINSVNHKLPIIMYNTIDNSFKIFDSDDLYYKYIGRKFEYNKHDCLSLVEEFYKDEFNISLPTYQRNNQTIENNPLIFIENINNYGFKELNENAELQNGDIIIINSLKGPTHLMIYIGNNQILHHRFNNISTVEQYTSFYKRNTYNIFRHKTLCN